MFNDITRPAFIRQIDENEAIIIDGYTLIIDEEHHSISIIKLKNKEDCKMSALTEKRQELVAKLETILTERNRDIAIKVAVYKQQLEAEPLPVEAAEIKKVIDAIDEVIAYDTANSQPAIAEPVITEPAIVEPITPEVVESVETVEPIAVETIQEVVIAEPVAEIVMPAGTVVAQPELTRPGIAAITIPERS